MPFLWSNPTPDDTTSAKLSAGFKVDAPNIGPLVAAILAHRDRQQQQNNQQAQQMTQAVSSGISNYMQQGKQDDAANAAMYAHLYPQDAASAYTDPGRVPDYGGVDALKMQQIVSHLSDPQLENALLRAKIDANDALAHNRWTYPPGSTSDPSVEARRQQIMHQQDITNARSNLSGTAGVPNNQLDAVIASLKGYTPGQTPFPAIGSKPAITDASEGPYKDAVLGAYHKYMQALNAPTPQASGGSADVNSQIQSIKAAYDRGELTRDQAAEQLRALGIAE